MSLEHMKVGMTAWMMKDNKNGAFVGGRKGKCGE